MSKIIKGVIDLPNFKEVTLDVLQDMLLFLMGNEVLEKYIIERNDTFVKVTDGGTWHYVRIFENGRVEYDDMWEKEALEIMKKIRRYYPMYKKTLEILDKVEAKTKSMFFDKQQEEITIVLDI